MRSMILNRVGYSDQPWLSISPRSGPHRRGHRRPRGGLGRPDHRRRPRPAPQPGGAPRLGARRRTGSSAGSPPGRRRSRSRTSPAIPTWAARTRAPPTTSPTSTASRPGPTPPERAHAWERFRALPAPAGYDPATIWPDGPDSPGAGVLRLEPYRVQVGLAADLAVARLHGMERSPDRSIPLHRPALRARLRASRVITSAGCCSRPGSGR